MPIKRQNYSYSCFEKAQTADERSAWIDSVIAVIRGLKNTTTAAYTDNN